MKQLVPLILMLFVTFLAAALLNYALFVVRPGLYGDAAAALLGGDLTKTRLADSLHVARADSLHAAPDSATGKTETPKLEIPRLYADTLNEMRRQLAAEQARTQELNRRMTSQAQAVDSAREQQRRNFAKMIEAMSAEDAARVLQNMDDSDIRTVLMAVKKRQAGKILGALEPRRVAKLMNQEGMKQ